MKPCPAARPVTCAYGTKGSAWSTGVHGGVDYGTPVGDPVYAMWDGTVTSKSWGSAYGNHIVIDHDRLPSGAPGLWAIYAHLRDEVARPGARVTAGQLIGYSGATGNVSGPHLHVEVQKGPDWKRGNYTDPQPWIDAGGSVSSTDGYLSLKETAPKKVRTNKDLLIDIKGKTNWVAETTGRATLALYLNLNLPPSGSEARKAINRGGVRVWFQQYGRTEDDKRDETGFMGPIPPPVYGDQYFLVAHSWPHTVDRDFWEFCFRVYAFDSAGKEVDIEIEVRTREIKIIGDKT